MSKVVTERERRGGTKGAVKTSAKLRPQSFGGDDHGPTRAPVSAHRQHGWNAKEFSDVLNPLKGYLKKQVGKPWRVVHSDLARHLDRRSITGQHIWDHVGSLVEQHCEERGKKVYRLKAYWRSGPEPEVTGFYVHPGSGLLCWKAPRRYVNKYRDPDPDLITLADGRKLRKIEGVWYESTMALSDQVPAGLLHLYHLEKQYREHKRQLGTKELKALGLRNDLPE